MVVVGLAFLLFAGLLALNNIGLTISTFAAGLLTGIIFVGIGLLLGERPFIKRP